ncbi:MAG: hypothetical protein GXP39_02900 [Chloroflexi bacterium]|nr:hypothetical protein [Chloroflexota bacterium]
MNEKLNLETIFAECVERVIEGESVQACLDRYPQHADDLAPLLETVLLVQSMAEPVPQRSPAARARARERFLARAEEMRARANAREQFLAAAEEMRAQTAGTRERPPQPVTRVRRPEAARESRRVSWIDWLRGRLVVRYLVPALGALLLIVLMVRGTVIASANSLPGDTLYPIKLFTERVQLLLAPEEERPVMEAKIEKRRVEETEIILETGRQATWWLYGVIEDVTSRTIQLHRFTIQLPENTLIKGIPQKGKKVRVQVYAPGDGRLLAQEIEVMGWPTPTPTPTVAPEPTSKPTVAPTPVWKPIQQPRSSGAGGAVPVKPTPTSSMRRRMPTPTSTRAPALEGEPTPTVPATVERMPPARATSDTGQVPGPTPSGTVVTVAPPTPTASPPAGTPEATPMTPTPEATAPTPVGEETPEATPVTSTPEVVVPTPTEEGTPAPPATATPIVVTPATPTPTRMPPPTRVPPGAVVPTPTPAAPPTVAIPSPTVEQAPAPTAEPTRAPLPSEGNVAPTATPALRPAPSTPSSPPPTRVPRR